MKNVWSMIKRYGMPVASQFKSAMPILVLIAIVFLLIGLWWLGPFWTWRGQQPLADLTLRILCTLLILMAPALGWLWALRRRNRRLEAERGALAQREDDPVLRFVQAQERALDQSLNVLRSNLKGRNAIYELPWYLVLGQENTGKTSFINRSSQSFSLSNEIKAGVRRAYADPDLAYDIDWWMGDEAVLIDPPGELVSQTEAAPAHEVADRVSDRAMSGGAAAAAAQAAPQSGAQVADQADGPVTPQSPPQSPPQAAPSSRSLGQVLLPPGAHARLWAGLLDWLGRNRSRRPLNGVVLMVDLVTLLNQKASDRKALAILLRTRLAELSRHLGTRPPLYVVLSKFDLLNGFEPFFARLPRAVREDIFGFTFTLDSVHDYDAWLDELAGRYDGFIQRLNEQIFDALGEAATMQAREALFSLVRQLAGMRPVLLSFLEDVLGSDRYITPALPRGVYFSSVYQQGLLCDAFINAASQSYGLEEAPAHAKPSGRSVVYFAQQVFQRIIYPEAGLAGDNLKVMADKRRTLLVGFGVAGLGCLLMAGGWYHYHGVNRQMAMSVLEKSREFSVHKIDGSSDPTGRNLLQPLDQIRSAVAVVGDYRSAWPVVSELGLYQGRKIGPKVDEAYLQLLSKRFLPELASGVMHAINSAPSGSNQQLAALRVYRMIEDRDNRRAPIVEDWMTQQWQAAYPGQGSVQNGLMRHLDYAMKYADAELPQHQARIADVQQRLRQLPMPQRVYMTMREQAGKILHSPLDLRHEVGPAFDILYKDPAAPGSTAGATTRIDPLLTAAGYHGYFAAHGKDFTDLAMIDRWTLGERQRIDYSEADKQVLAERVRALYSSDYIDTWQRNLNQLEVVDFNDLGQAVTVLGNVTSPAAPLRRLLETVRDNTVLSPPSPGVATPGQPTDKVEPVTANAITGANVPQVAVIARPFAPLSELLLSKGDKPSYLDESMGAIGRVHDTLKGVHDSAEPGKAALAVVLDRFALKGADPIGNLQRVAVGLPEPLNRQVKKLADESSQVLLIEALKELERRWDTDVYRYYQERLAGRYPFNPNSRVDASLEDFTALFGPQGRLTQFKEQYLKLFFDDNLEALYSERRGGYLVRMDVLEQLEAADRIRDAFFNSRGALGVQFSIEPLGLTSSRRSSVLSVEGQLIAYSHGPSNSVGLIWPNNLGDSTESRITLVSAAGTSSGLVYRGSWSMFRLLSQARLDSATANSVDLSFSANDGAMRYRITAEKSNNPFTQASFDGFVLPQTLLAEASKPTPTPPAPLFTPAANPKASTPKGPTRSPPKAGAALPKLAINAAPR
ncbi:type VI secretion system membrane subunit TssM [Achromobacter spanius]|uniref:Type VI secretion system membrane subunit TssM n=1 Tax=Achromobacter spanius TaxID=217203 RepID=A0A2S5GQ99_9BURK|nr:type VI secretion system membrane subunit TssM [Achromobacter spanius]PPA75118.1 type VI secretion system membrane subunit TssM [Achromobacter spanius]